MAFKDWIKIAGYVIAILATLWGVKAKMEASKPVEVQKPAMVFNLPAVKTAAVEKKVQEVSTKVQSLPSQEEVEAVKKAVNKLIEKVDALEQKVSEFKSCTCSQEVKAPVEPPAGIEQPKKDQPTVVEWQYDLKEAKRLSQSLNRPMFLAFSTTGCLPCERAKAFVFPKSKVIDKLQQEYVPVWVYVKDSRTQSIANEYGISRFPKSVVAWPDQKVGVFTTPDDPDLFLSELSRFE